jgi:hypothetical protein
MVDYIETVKSQLRNWMKTNLPAVSKASFLRSEGLFLLLCFALQITAGCSAIRSSATNNLAASLSRAISDSNDLATVKAGGPAYLLMIDGLIHDDPDSEKLLRAGAGLYTAYTTTFVSDKPRALKLTNKGLQYGLHALCVRRADSCGLRNMKFNDFDHLIATMEVRDVPALYALGSAWAGWIQARSGDLNAIAEISRIEVIMKRVVALDESYKDGGAHLYLGVLSTLVAPASGGKPEEGRRHFKRAIDLSTGKNLMAKVLFAKHYARIVFDRELHDMLLIEVLEANPNISGYTLVNTLAQEQAAKLLKSAEDYF